MLNIAGVIKYKNKYWSWNRFQELWNMYSKDIVGFLAMLKKDVETGKKEVL